MKYFFRTLGCKMNLVDSARMAEALTHLGHTVVSHEDDADVVVINSCTVTAESDRKSRRAAQSASRRGKSVIVMGCGPKVEKEKWHHHLPLARILASNHDILQFLDRPLDTTGLSSFPRTRLPIPIQTGCNNTCAYCITRLARGPHHNESLPTILHAVREAIDLGMHEVVLTGINLAAWGCKSTRRPEQSQLPFLLQSLLDHTCIPWIRLSSLGPEYLNQAFFEVFQNERICDHLHLSVQSGSASVLARMLRGHGVKEVIEAAERAKAARNDVALTADFIVGFPGETEKEFQETMDLVRHVGFARLHVFPFSPREGTLAFSMPDQVPPEVKKQRSLALRTLGDELRDAFVATQVNRRKKALLQSDGTALTSNYLRLRAKGEPGTFIDVVVDRKQLLER